MLLAGSGGQKRLERIREDAERLAAEIIDAYNGD